MSLLKGQRVTHPKMPDWGVGQVLEDSDGINVLVFFEGAGLKRLKLQHASLMLVNGGPQSEYACDQPTIDRINMERIQAACDSFYAVMKDNRSNCNDGSLAINVMRDLHDRRSLSPATLRQLSSWCHTNGSVYQRGVDLAQDISLAIFGRVVTKLD